MTKIKIDECFMQFTAFRKFKVEANLCRVFLEYYIFYTKSWCKKLSSFRGDIYILMVDHQRTTKVNELEQNLLDLELLKSS